MQVQVTVSSQHEYADKQSLAMDTLKVAAEDHPGGHATACLMVPSFKQG